MPDLKLVALDSDDLAVVSACVQDAVLQVGDLEWHPSRGCFALSMNRFAWERQIEDGARPGEAERHRACLHFARVRRVSSHGIDRTRRDAILVLLAVTYRPTEDPSGIVELVFAGDAAIRLDVECLEAQLADLGAAWATRHVPVHDL